MDQNLRQSTLLLAAYRKWGADCPLHINGDFAFAVWDRRRRQLFLARDHLGVRPLYYFHEGPLFAFATDMRALLALPFISGRLDEVELYAAIGDVFHIDAEATYFAGIRRLRAAHVLTFGAQGLRRQRYWTPGACKIRYPSEDEYSRAMAELVADAVRIRVSPPAAIGAELSGGIDSSVVTVLAGRELKKDNRPLSLFSWAPSYELLEKQPGDEREMIEAVCRQEGLECRLFDPRIPLRPGVSRIEPEFDFGEVFLQEFQHMASRGVSRILSGWGGDEGISLRCSLYSLLFNGYPKAFWGEARVSARGSWRRMAKILTVNLAFRLLNAHVYYGDPGKGIPGIVSRSFADRIKRRCRRDFSFYSSNPAEYIESGHLQTRTELVAWLGADYGVQYAFPFLDRRVVDFAVSIPRHLYHKGGVNRYLFRRAFAPLLPDAGSGFLVKNDVASATYIAGIRRETALRLRSLASRLERGLFDAYLDWEALARIVDSPTLGGEEDEELLMRTLAKVQACGYIQQVLAEAGRD